MIGFEKLTDLLLFSACFDLLLFLHGSIRYAMDVLIVTLFVQTGAMFSNYFWLVYLVIPGYLLYHGGRMLLNYVFTPNASTDEDENDPAALKRREKAERKAAQPKYKNSRR